MRNIACLLCFVAFSRVTSGQAPTLSLTTEKTTSLVFPLPVRYVDRGSPALLAQVVPGAGHILLVKAATKGFAPTNLSVITGDGKLYAFPVRYAAQPDTLVYYLLGGVAGSGGEPAFRGQLPSGVPIGRAKSRGKVVGYLQGLYSREQQLWMALHLHNRSAIDYDIEELRVFITRPSRRKEGGTPLNHRVVEGKGSIGAFDSGRLLIALPKRTLDRGERLVLSLREGSGGRHLRFTVRPGAILGAVPVRGEGL
jgi:hypothetical protein